MNSRLLSNRSVFVDTGAHCALMVVQDMNHSRAVDAARSLVRQGWRLHTSNFVVAATHALILARAGRDAALRALHRIDQSAQITIRIEETDEQRARAILERYHDKSFSLTDATSFAVMERLGINWAFTFDRHFLQFGFDVVGLERA
jgi:predicted nucleic acid-binding protein